MASRRQGTLVALAVVLVALWLAPAAWAGRGQESILQDDTVLVYGSGSQVEATMSQLRALGVDRVRVSVIWRLVAPSPTSLSRPSFNGRSATDPAGYPSGAWDRYDRIVNAARRNGLRLLFTVTGPSPSWATGSATTSAAPNPALFREFVTALGRRYSGSHRDESPQPTPRPGGLPILTPPPPPPPPPSPVLPRVNFWSIWNEPNQPGWLRPQTSGGAPFAPHRYRALVDAAWAGFSDSGHGSDTILLAETAPRGNRRLDGGPMRPGIFIREMYCLNRRLRFINGAAARGRGCPSTAAGRSGFRASHPGLFRASGWAHHPYALEAPPTRQDPVRDHLVISGLSRLTRLLDRTQRKWGSGRRFPVWLTEYGYQTNPPDRFLGVSFRRQAGWINEGDHLAFRSRRVRSVAQFLLIDDGPNTSVSPGSFRYWGSTFQTGIVGLDGRRKLSYFSYQRPFDVAPKRVRRGKRVRVFGQLRPARNGAFLRARLQFRRRGGAWRTIRRLTTRNSQNYLALRTRVRRSGSYRLAWGSSGSAQLTRSVSVRALRPRR